MAPQNDIVCRIVLTADERKGEHWHPSMATKIMVVDDEPEIVELVRLCLEANGYRVLPFSVSEEAAKCAEEHQLDGAVIDVAMPGIDGLTLVRRIRASTLNARIAIVMLTGYNDVGTARQSLVSGATDFLSKPFNPRELLDALTRARHAAALGNRRRARVPLHTEVRCNCEDRQFTARLLNISEDGALLQSSFSLDPDSGISLQFELPKVISFISPACRVVRIEQPDLMGLKFVGLGSNQRRALRDFVALMD